MFYSCELYFVFRCRQTSVLVFVILIQSDYPEKLMEFELFQFVHKMAEL